MKLKIQIKNGFTGSLIFEFEKEDNSISKTVKEYIRLAREEGRSANLSYANLRYADLRYANLRYADLRYANLRSADLRSADLSYANLSYANLRYADVRYADVRYADLSYANLSYANLRSANLSYANLRSADLSSADVRYADVRYADLSSANLRSAVGSELSIAMTRICPAGDIIGWKKCRDNKIVKLLIPADAKRNNAFGRKCRAEYAKVLEVEGGGIAISSNDKKFEYTEGEIVRPDKFNEDFTDECSGGIHFFITREEAVAYAI